MISDASQRALRGYVEQLEQLESEKRAIGDDIKEKFAEIKSTGFCVKTIRKVLKLRKQTEDERAESEAILDTYLVAMGMAGTPLGDYADARDAEGTALQ